MVSIRFPVAGWKVERIETESADTVATLADPIDGLTSYRVAHTIAKANDQTAQLRFVCRKPSGQVETVTASIVCFGFSKKEAVR